MDILEKIRIGKKVEVEVNDDGESIVLNFDDCTFIDNFFNITNSLESASKFFEREFKEMDTHEQVKATKEKMQGIMEEIDNLFGKESCRKIFGQIIPSPYLIFELFDKLIPIIKKHSDERQQRIAEKYSNQRKGSGIKDE